MADAIISESAHTRFNISGPPLPFNGTSTALTTSAVGETTADPNIPGILFGLLVPHTVCTLVILARCWSRLRLLRKWFLDDSLIMVAYLFSTTVLVAYCIAAQSPRPAPHAMLTSPVYDAPTAVRTYLGLIFYQLCLCLTKLSILAFYLRIFSSRPLERRLAWATVIAVLLYGVPLLFMSVFQCHPVAGQFFGSPMRCFSFAPLLIASAALHTATDAWLIILIVPCIVRLDLPGRQKAALAVVLSLSIFVIAASLTRLQLSLRASDKDDGTSVANTLSFFVMTVLELDLALICASAPTLRLVLARWWPKLMGDPSIDVQARRRSGEPTGSVDLTSVVSYHGYPWTASGTSSRSKNPSVNNLQGVPPPPMPPPVAFYRTPTTLSLRSLITPKSRGQREADREGLLVDGDERRRSSVVGWEAYEQFLPGYGENKRGSRVLGSRRSSRRVSGRWGDSQESFVLGMNDPNSPTRLSPVQSEGLKSIESREEPSEGRK
ncbi:hypothetical protein OQA88_6967 [Cercophora sp. LCS_1]